MKQTTRKKITTLSALLFVLSVCSVAATNPSTTQLRPVCEMGKMGTGAPDTCGAMCDDRTSGDPNGTEMADCEGCCDQMGQTNAKCYTGCATDHDEPCICFYSQ